MNVEPWFRAGQPWETKWVATRMLERSWEEERDRAKPFTMTLKGQKLDLRAQGARGKGLPILKDDDIVVVVTGRRDATGLFWVTIFPGFGWDGSSFISVDSRLNAIAAVIHDGLYRANRLGLLGVFTWQQSLLLRWAADSQFGRLMRFRMVGWPLKGWQWFRSFYHEYGLKMGAWAAWQRT